METMTLTQLRYVIAVAESKSMNEASKQLLYHNPVCLQQLRNLKRKQVWKSLEEAIKVL